MPYKGPHISTPPEVLIPRVLGIDSATFATWPEAVREVALAAAAELFLVRYNPFVDREACWKSASESFERSRHALAPEFAQAIGDGMLRYWESFQADWKFREEIIRRCRAFLPADAIDTRPNSRVECSTDATDLRMELPLLALLPGSTPEIRDIVRLAQEMGFALIPRGGGSGLTGGAIPGAGRSVILSLSRLKAILSVNAEDRVLCAQSGVITLDAIKAAAAKNLLFTVDPASKAASSLGGNISENSGGPFAFEYGCTIDNILSYRMVTPAGEVIEVRRRDHPWHKILPEETAVFDILAENGERLDAVSLSGLEVRGKDLGKDVTNKYLGGLPGVQKEGVDGVITEACFVLHPRPALSRTLCLEFFGRSMHNAMLVITDIVRLRDAIRREGDKVKLSALEEFGPKYVQAIEYKKKSSTYEGDPISVLLVQLDSDDEEALNRSVDAVVDIVAPYDQVDAFVARDETEAEVFWEDRHRLSAISRRTSGFKINEDVVIPIAVIPEFSDFLEDLNLKYMAKAYRAGLQDVGRLPGFAEEDRFLNMEFTHTGKIIKGQVSAKETNDQELELQAFYFFRDLKSRYPKLGDRLDEVYARLMATRIIVANHMHAGDGNCHVNVPVNSNDPVMLGLAQEAVEEVIAKVLSLGGVVSGEHGIGITKIAFLPEDRITALREYKERVDPRDILNPGKLTTRKLPATPFTFSFNRLIQDLKTSGLPNRDRLIRILTNIQTCTRCGKCKQVCPMYQPREAIIHHPRNKNISIGALMEAIYYSQVLTGHPAPELLDQLRDLVDHCTACGKCMAVCPVKINTPEVTLNMRAFLEEKGAGGHPLKTRVLAYLAADPARRVPTAAKALSVGQSLVNATVGVIPSAWRRRIANPVLHGKGPDLDFRNLGEKLDLMQGSIFIPEGADARQAVLYYPGCGARLFSPPIGMAALYLLLSAKVAVVTPPEHQCCGYPLLASGFDEAFRSNRERNQASLAELLNRAALSGLAVRHVLTACGSCREGLKEYSLDTGKTPLAHADVTQFLMSRPEYALPAPDACEPVLYHAACHAEWSGLDPVKSGAAYAAAVSRLAGCQAKVTPGCCAESGLGALTTPAIYNRLRRQKQERLAADLGDDAAIPVLVGCPSCKVGIRRCLNGLNRKNPVLHALEYLAAKAGGRDWKKRLLTLARESRAGSRRAGG
ncbi:MAG: FAD-binding and (Fe-S)-binding domain-containing protein [Thermodesulfobacteriota bacterium]